jgi:hypothetical protein
LKGRDKLGNLSIDGKIILKINLKEMCESGDWTEVV